MRWIGSLLILAALAALALDVVAAGSLEFELRPLGELWNELHSESLQLTQAALERHLHPTLWNNVLFPMLLMPAAGVLAGLALVFFALSLLISGRRRA